MSWKRSSIVAIIVVLSMIPTTIPTEASPIKDYKYSYKVMHGIVQVLKTEEDLHVFEAIEWAQSVPQAEAMDLYLEKLEPRIDGRDLRFTVREVFGINLQAVSDLEAGKQVKEYPDYIKDALGQEDLLSLSKSEVMDLYVEALQGELSGPEIRTLINDIFGINLDGISRLEKSGISLFSKEQWIMQGERDLFAVYTGLNDVDVYIKPTAYFTEQTGMEQLPEELQQLLEEVGYWYNEDLGEYYYEHPDGESVPDAFKGQTLGTLAQYIQQEYLDLLQ
ncbi:hypothetical protein LCM20_16100 [Halobacillus litoralis]|uniref:hypothetical protein n=1 Tax=Halobacillus litoralis TaxID=45668 RepID=UPI001CD22386|nr:hypothetical protein [Halobacillus litoralis]MCA0972130.1 hypothetical protein [Halobacillus litoralis]